MDPFAQNMMDALTQKIDHRTAEGRATIHLVCARGCNQCALTGLNLDPHLDVWIEVVMTEHPNETKREYVGVRSGVFDAPGFQETLTEWRARPGWAVEVWDGRVLWPQCSPGEQPPA
ncbi:hypothetical protein LO763_22655 [Glycomyces sp. A-F 0318]|uniref:hypothetical protein n=1 Tax=Glycomyces amatae TaxID=2881355 RepID=UPI001E3B8265|nr:hypothetical protein [Glycomyces amatae]MCD0446421.1 hypothetical protein [Glycomyces amatae]